MPPIRSRGAQALHLPTLGPTAAWVTLPVALLAVGRLLPPTGVGLALRVGAAAALVLLVPGGLVLRAIVGPREPGLWAASAVLWSLALAAVSLGIAFATGLSIDLALAALLAMSAALVCVPGRGRPRVAAGDRSALAAVAVGGVALGALVWWSTGTIGGSVGPTAGDALFHLARVRKLVELRSLSLRALDEFRDGGLHPGYAFPLWHGAEAMIVRLAGVDAAPAFLYLPAVLTPLVLIVAYAAGRALFGSPAGGAATALAEVALLAASRGGVGGLQFLAQPGAVARLLLVPSLLALLFAHEASPGRRLLATTAVGSLALVLIHPTYVAYAVLLAGSFAAARLALGPNGRAPALRACASIGAMLVPLALGLTWLLPLARQAAAFSPSAAETRRALGRYASEVALHGASYSLRPGYLAWGGAATVAALTLVPVAGLARRRPWSAYVLGPTAALGAIALTPLLFTGFASVMSLSQALRIGGFLPLAAALAGAAEIAALAGAAALPLAGAAGVAAAILASSTGGEVWAVWLAVGGAWVLLALGALRRLPDVSPPPRQRWIAVVAVGFLLPIVASGLAHPKRWDAPDPYALTPGLVRAIDAKVGRRDVIFSNVETSYRISGAAPVYVAASLPGHVARTLANRPYERQYDAVRFFFRPRVPDLERWAILHRYGAGWVVVDRQQRFTPFVRRLTLVYADGRYRLYRVPANRSSAVNARSPA
jgi:hypothetical protein